MVRPTFCNNTTEILIAIKGMKPSRTGWGRAHCPVCQSRTGSTGSSKSMVAHFGLGFWKCFRCHAFGKFQKQEGFSDTTPSKSFQVTEVQIPEGYEPLWREPGLSSMALQPARDYLQRRGILPNTIREARIGAAYSGPAAGRVIVPLIGLDGRWAGWSARLWAGPYPTKMNHPLAPSNLGRDAVLCHLWQEASLLLGRQDRAAPKYLTGPGTARDTILWHEAALYEETWRPLLLVEGVFDALPYWPNAAAFLGKPAEKQIQKLLHANRPIIVALDGDSWLEAEMLALRLELDSYYQKKDLKISWVRIPPKRDPGNFDICRLQPNNVLTLQKPVGREEYHEITA